jgi:hypothetical protein
VKKKPKETRKDRASLRLCHAAANWAKVNGGSVLVAGSIQTIKWPEDRKLNYTIGIRCTGIAPTATSASIKGPDA